MTLAPPPPFAADRPAPPARPERKPPFRASAAPLAARTAAIASSGAANAFIMSLTRDRP